MTTAAPPRHFLALDTGEIHHGAALVRYDGKIVKALFLGTLCLEPKPLIDMVDPRGAARGTRRTYKEHKRRLNRLRDLLTGKAGPLAGDPDIAASVLAYCKRRGHFHSQEDEEGGTGAEVEDQEEATLAADQENDSSDKESDAVPEGSIPNKEFLEHLKNYLDGLISDPCKREQAYTHCFSVLGRRSRRPMRVNARGVGVCAWEGCRNRVTRAGLGSVVMGVSGKMKPLIEREVVSRDKIVEVCRAAIGGSDGAESLLSRIDQSILDACGLPPRPGKRGRPLKPSDSIEEWIPLLSKPEKIGVLGVDPAKAREIRRILRLWAEKRQKESIRKGVERDLAAARKNAAGNAKGKKIGRSRFCPKHQDAYVELFPTGERPPLKTESADVSRKASILADKISSYLHRRVLPLLDGQPLDASVVEASGFDALRMLVKKNPDGTIKRVSEDKAYELYWRGPRADFGTVEEMLRTEFGGLCAYCGGKIGGSLEQDHILPRSRFPMDGYLVRVSCHSTCNREKGKDSIFRRRLSIHPAALEAFEKYVDAKKRKDLAIHPIIEVKKGLLQNMTAESLKERLAKAGGDVDKAEISLQEMAGGWMVRATATSRHARHLKKELSRRLGVRVQSVSGRHTSILRAALTDGWNYDKASAKAAGDKVDNHALDAYVLALGTATGFFERLAMAERFGRTDFEDLLAETIAKADPMFRRARRFELDGFKPLAGAEALSPGMGVVASGIRKKDAAGVSLTNTTPRTRKRSAFDQNLYTMAGKDGDEPAKRVSVQDFVKKLDKCKTSEDKMKDLLVRVTHGRLRERLEDALKKRGTAGVKDELVSWYKETARGYDRGGSVRHAGHPSIQARWKGIQAFLDKPDATVADIPQGFSIRLIQEGRGKDVTPLVRRGAKHFRLAGSGVVAMVVGNRRGADGQPDRGKPVVLKIGADWRVEKESGGGYRDIPPLDTRLGEPLLHDGTPLGPRIRRKRQAVLEWMRRGAGCVEIHWVRAGNTVIKGDGSRIYLHSFKTEELPRGVFKEIVRVERAMIGAAEESRAA